MSIWTGIKNFVSKPVELIKAMVTKIRKFLPFSPAKEGPLRDIHRIRLVETIAESIRVQPVVKAMQRVGQAVFNTKPAGALQLAGNGGGGVTLHVHLNRDASKSDITRITTEMRRQVVQIMKDETGRLARVSF